MKKILVLMTGLWVFAAVNVWALTIDSIAVTGETNTSGAVTINATINGVVGVGSANYQVTSTNGLSRRYFQSTQISGTSWSDTNWSPYFTGKFTIEITAFDYSGGMPQTASTTVTVTRATSGTINNMQYSSAPYNAAGVWSNVDVSMVKMHDIGLNLDFVGVGSIGCNLLNANPTITQNMTEEQRDIAYTDTGSYKPAGTPYRFNVSLHARPRGFMGMGEIKRWIWAPADTNAPDGEGTLTVDITSCSPWRSSYSNALQSHVGFAPLFAPSSFAMMPTGMIQCTTAHYMDVGPTNTGSQTAARCGLRVNGHTGTNSYLKTFLSDTFLQQQFGLTNPLDATNIMAGFVQHFNTNNAPIDDVTQVTASFTRIEGGTNLIYDYNFDGVGDAGFEARMDFTFQSSVAAQMGMAATNVVPSVPTNVSAGKGTHIAQVCVHWDSVSNATSYQVWRNTSDATNSATKFDTEPAAASFDDTNVTVGVVYYYWVKAKNSAGVSGFSSSDSGYAMDAHNALAADFDGDRLADPAVYNTNGNWKIKLSSGGYSLLPLTGFLGGHEYTALAADFDGDRLADPAIYNAESELWAVKLSSLSYLAPTVLTSFGGSGWEALANDFDGDRLADPAVYQSSTGTWKVKLSTAGYATITKPALLGFTGPGWTAIAADFDGDRKVDPAIYQSSTGSWIVMLSVMAYTTAILEPGFLGSTGYAGMAADFDGDAKADPTVAQTSTGNWKIKLSGGGYSLLDLPGFLGQ